MKAARTPPDIDSWNEYEEALKIIYDLQLPYEMHVSERVANAMIEQRALEAERAAKVLSDEGFVGLPREVTGRAAYLRGFKKA